MMLGSDYIYECPKCGHFLKKSTLISGNTFYGADYSDGKSIKPMLPDFPDLTKCKNCDNIFWLSNLKKIGEDDSSWWEVANSKWANVEYAEFLNIKDLFRALEISKPQEEEIIRTWILWAFNDRIRDGGKGMFIEEDDKDLWEQNCKALLNLLSDDNFDKKYMKAELYRNLGEFEKCIDLIESINFNDKNDKDLRWKTDLKNQMKYKAGKKVQSVFKTSKVGKLQIINQNLIEITGRLIQVLPIQTVEVRNGRVWKKREIILEINSIDPNLCVTFFNDKLFPDLIEGSILKVSCVIASIEHNKEWFTRLIGRKVEEVLEVD